MSDNIHPPGTSEVIAARDVGGVLFQRSILTTAAGADIDPATAGAQATANASLSAIDGKLPALVGGAVPVTLDAAALAALETVELGAATIASLTTGGGLTDTQLRATPVPVSGTVELGGTSLAALESITIGGTVELGATSLAALESTTASGPLTDTQLRAAAVPISLDAAALAALETTELGATTIAALTTGGGLTDTQLRATAVPVSAASLPLPTGAAAEATLSAMSSKVPALGQALAAASTPVVLTAAQVTALTPPAYSYISSPSQSPYGLVAKIDPFGPLTVTSGTTPLFNDAFDSVTLDTANRWTLGGTTLPAIASGSAVASLGATNSVSSVLVSQPTFSPTTQPFFVAGQLTVGSQQTNPNAHRWFGMGTVTSYAASTPITDGHGFEVDVTGALNAVVYIAGVRYVVNSTNPALITGSGSWAANMTMSNYGATLTWPPTGVAIVLVRYYNGYAYFYMAGAATGFDVPIGVASWVPATTSYPLRFAAITTPAVSTVLATTFTLAGFIMGASDGSNLTISDPTNPWRQAGVNTTIPLGSDGAMDVRQAPSDIFRTSFADAYTGAVTPEFLLQKTGTGMAVNQTGGNLVITSGTTANSETLIRSVRTFRGSLSLRFKSILSQRIVQNTFIVELADLLGELLAYTINSATSVTVTFPFVNPFTAVNVGQFVNLGVITGAAGLPGRFAIASVSGLTVTFTVASWPGSGSGTLTLYGWNYIRANYNGVTATNVGFDAQRRGWNSGDSVLTTLTSASPGHVAAIQTDSSFVDYSDALVATGATPGFTSRGSRLENVPGDDVSLYLFIRVLNGTTNPATTTTWTVGMCLVEQLGNQKVFLAGTLNSSVNRSMPVTGAVTVSSGTLTTVSTVTAVTTLTTLANGQTAHSAASTGSPIRTAGRVQTAADTTLIAGDACDIFMTTGGAQVVKPYAVPELDWYYSAIPSGLVNTTTPVTIKGAPAAGTRNYITALNLTADALGSATEFAIRDTAIAATSQTIASNILTTSTNHGWAIGDTVVPSASTVTGLTAGVAVYVLTVPSAVTATFSATPGGSTLAISGTGVTATLNHYLLRLKLQTGGIAVPTAIPLPTPLKGGTALAQEMVTLTAATGGVYANAQGYVAV